jgi:hypothetical protein
MEEIMNRSTKAVTFPFALALALAGSNAMAERITAEQIYAELPAEIAQDGRKFMNPDQDSRHRLNEDVMPQGKTVRERKELQVQQNKKAKHQHQYKEMESGPHQNRSGSFGAFSGRGPGGGGGRGR